MNIRLLGAGDCEVRHMESGTVLRTSKSPQFGGSGSSFSSTDLLAAALGTCIGTDIEQVAEREGVSLESIRIVARRLLADAPRRVEALVVHVIVRGPVSELTLLKLRRAADACLVQRSIGPDVKCEIDVGAST